MIQKRLFTFGCSFTKYFWPTWADIIGTNYQNHYNLGQPGAGNYYIALKLYETHLKHKITKDDDVIIMLSSTNRLDIYDDKTNKFDLHGNIYNSEHIFGKKFVNDVWNDSHSLYNTWFSVKSIKSLLDGIGCTYKIVEAFGIFKTDEGTTLNINDNLKIIRDDYLNSVYTIESLDNFSKKYNPSSYVMPNGKLDGHPTITCNNDFVKIHISEFYNPNMGELVKRWETDITNIIATNKFLPHKLKINVI